jgi:putative SOS response-associated peptidase YedK
MCGRFTQRYTWHEMRDLYELVGDARNLQAHYNIAPTDTVEVVRPGDSTVTSEARQVMWNCCPASRSYGTPRNIAKATRFSGQTSERRHVVAADEV